ncbi:unnamed protein product [Penicillium pancosmium]
MSDPFSVAGSAVGVISLGLQVCGKIVNYTQAVRGQNDDIQNLASKAENIRCSLKQLRELIEETRDDSPDFASDLEVQAFGLKANVEKLRAKIEQYKPVATETFQDKARSTFKKVIYPLKKEALFEIGGCLDGMQATLRTALSIFELKQDSLHVKQDQLLERLNTVQLALTNLSPQSVLQQPPSRVKQLCDQFSDQTWLGSLSPAQRKLHAKQAKKRYTYRSTWLGFLVTGTFSLSSGSGGLSIAPSLKFSAVVDDKSWSGTMFLSGSLPNGEPTFYIWRHIEYLIQQSQYAFSAGKATPTDIVGPRTIPLIYAPFWFGMSPDREDFPAVCKFIKYMLSCGATLEYDGPFSLSIILCGAYLWTEEEFMFIPHIIEMEGPINRPPDSWIAKRNMQEILRRDEDCKKLIRLFPSMPLTHTAGINLPAAYIAVLRESHEDLQEIIKSNTRLPDNGIHGVSVLQSAMGWPAGVGLLLEEGLNTELPILYHCQFSNVITDEDSEIDKYVDSCKILFEAEYKLSASDIFRTGSDKLKVVFLEELAKRRNSLLEIANARFHPSELSDIRKGETGLPDAQAYRICAALMRKGIDVGHPLRAVEGESLHRDTAPLDILKKAYELGFTDIIQRIPKGGYTPLELYCSQSYGHVLEQITWLILKGANPMERFPRSNTTVTHLLSATLGERIYRGFDGGNPFDPTPFHQVVDHLLSTSFKDACSCPCSVGGCTTLSVAIRFGNYLGYGRPKDITQEAAVFRNFLQFLIEYNRSSSQACRSIIRSLTFDGLGLTHSCCTELNYWHPGSDFREEHDLLEIMEEQIEQAERFEGLVAEFESHFDACGLPLMDFLQGVWYERMIRFISQRDPFDPKHHEEVGKLGVSLEMDDVEIPYFVQLICDQVRVVEDDSDSS